MHVFESMPTESDQTPLLLLCAALMNREGGELARWSKRSKPRDVPAPFFYFNWPHGSGLAVYLHDNEKVENQNEGGQERSGDLVAGQEASIQVVPADPIGTDDQNHHRRQRDEHCPAGRQKKEGRKEGKEG